MYAPQKTREYGLMQTEIFDMEGYTIFFIAYRPLERRSDLQLLADWFVVAFSALQSYRPILTSDRHEVFDKDYYNILSLKNVYADRRHKPPRVVTTECGAAAFWFPEGTTTEQIYEWFKKNRSDDYCFFMVVKQGDDPRRKGKLRQSEHL